MLPEHGAQRHPGLLGAPLMETSFLRSAEKAARYWSGGNRQCSEPGRSGSAGASEMSAM
jgi:hypothetical protein